MAATFAERVRRAGGKAEWSIESAGTEVSQELRMCGIAASLAPDGDASREFCEDHRSQPVRAELLEGMRCVIAASRSERGALARLDPAQRPVTFTLKEAVLLGAAPFSAAEAARAAEAAGAGEPLRAYAHALDARRSSAQLLLGARSRLPALAGLLRRATGRTRPHPLDLPDTHHLSDRRHRRGLVEARDLVNTFHDQLQRFLRAVQDS